MMEKEFVSTKIHPALQDTKMMEEEMFALVNLLNASKDLRMMEVVFSVC